MMIIWINFVFGPCQGLPYPYICVWVKININIVYDKINEGCFIRDLLYFLVTFCNFLLLKPVKSGNTLIPLIKPKYAFILKFHTKKKQIKNIMIGF